MDSSHDDDLSERIKAFLAQDSNFRNANFDPAPFLIEILKEKESDEQIIIDKQKQMIDLENEAFDLIDEVSYEYSDQFFRVLDVPQKQGQQLEKLKSNMSIVKKKVKQTKGLLMATQKDINQLHLNCLFNKIIYKRVKEIELKLSQYETASLSLKNNEFLACSTNLPTFKSSSVLETALASKTENLQLRLLSRGVEEVTMFLYLTPKIVLPATQSLIDRVSSEESFLDNLKKHDGFHKRYELFKKAFCLDYLPTIWDFKDLEKKTGKIHMVYDIIRGIMYIGSVSELVLSLELDCKKSVSSIFILLQYFFSNEIEASEKKQRRNEAAKGQKQWFLSQDHKLHTTFISTVMDIIGVILRKLCIIRKILKEFEIESNNSLTSFYVFELLLAELNELVEDIYIKGADSQFGFVKEGMMKKIKREGNYIYWGTIRNIIVRSVIIIEENLKMIEQKYELGCQYKDHWNNIVRVSDFDAQFYEKFHLDILKALQEIFSHEGKSFAFEPLEHIARMRALGEKELNFCKYFNSGEMKYCKEHVFTIGFMEAIHQFFERNNFDPVRSQKYLLFLLAVFYLKLNYYLQRFIFSSKTLQRAYELRKSNYKFKAKQKDLIRQFDKIYVKHKKQIVVKPWRRSMDEEIQHSKYRMIENLKEYQKQNLMIISYYLKYIGDFQQFKESDNILPFVGMFEKLEPNNFDENFQAKLIKIWDQLPEIHTSIMEATLALLQKMFELHLAVVSIIYLETIVN